MRGATGGTQAGDAQNQISIHAPREGSDALGTIEGVDDEISIHAPREGSDEAIFWHIKVQS